MVKAEQETITIKARKTIRDASCSCGGRPEPAFIPVTIKGVVFNVEGVKCPQCGEGAFHPDTQRRLEKEARKRGLIPESLLKGLI